MTTSSIRMLSIIHARIDYLIALNDFCYKANCHMQLDSVEYFVVLIAVFTRKIINTLQG